MKEFPPEQFQTYARSCGYSWAAFIVLLWFFKDYFCPIVSSAVFREAVVVTGSAFWRKMS
jgi:hypothetical protein